MQVEEERLVRMGRPRLFDDRQRTGDVDPGIRAQIEERQGCASQGVGGPEGADEAASGAPVHLLGLGDPTAERGSRILPGEELGTPQEHERLGQSLADPGRSGGVELDRRLGLPDGCPQDRTPVRAPVHQRATLLRQERRPDVVDLRVGGGHCHGRGVNRDALVERLVAGQATLLEVMAVPVETQHEQVPCPHVARGKFHGPPHQLHRPSKARETAVPPEVGGQPLRVHEQRSLGEEQLRRVRIEPGGEVEPLLRIDHERGRVLPLPGGELGAANVEACQEEQQPEIAPAPLRRRAQRDLALLERGEPIDQFLGIAPALRLGHPGLSLEHARLVAFGGDREDLLGPRPRRRQVPLEQRHPGLEPGEPPASARSLGQEAQRRIAKVPLQGGQPLVARAGAERPQRALPLPLVEPSHHLPEPLRDLRAT